MKSLINIVASLSLIISISSATVFGQTQDLRVWIQNGDTFLRQGNRNAAIQDYNYAYRLAEQRWDWSGALTLTQRYLSLGQETPALNAFRFATFAGWNLAVDSSTGALRLRSNAQQVASGEQGLATIVNEWNNTLRYMRMSASVQQWMQQNAKQAYDSYQTLQQMKRGTTTNPPPPPPPTTRPPFVASKMDWTTNADSPSLQMGQRYACTCPPNGSLGYLYGFKVYRSDGSICAAAVQMGFITLASGGTVVIEIRPGEPFAPGNQNGVSSSSGAASQRAFSVIGRL